MGSEGFNMRVGLESNSLTSSANLVECLKSVIEKLREALLNGLDIWIFVYGSRSQYGKSSALAKLLFGEIDLGIIGLDSVKATRTFNRVNKLTGMVLKFEGLEPSTKAVIKGLATCFYLGIRVLRKL